MHYKNNESGEHIRGKYILRDLFLKDNKNISDIWLETRKGNHIADLYLILNKNVKNPLILLIKLRWILFFQMYSVLLVLLL